MTVATFDVRLPPLRLSERDQDEEFLRAHQLGAVALAGTGGWALFMAWREQALNRRQRGLAVAVCAATTAGGVAGFVRPRLITRAQRRLRPLAAPAAGLIGVGLSRPAVSPMFFPSLALTAIGASTLDRRTGRALGRLTAAAYVLLVAASERRLGKDLLWNVGMCSAYSVSGLVGAELGRVALDVRSLERARQRDLRFLAQPERIRADVERAAADASTVALELERVLLDIAGRDHGDHARDVLDDIARIRRPVHHLEMARQLISAARSESIDLAAAIERMLESFRAPLETAGAVAEMHLGLSAGAVYDARAGLALLVTLKRAIDNAILHGPQLTRVVVEATLERGRLSLTVTDDGGGDPPGESDYGTGLSEAANRCEQLGGSLSFLPHAAGVKLRAEVPAAPLEVPRDMVPERSFSARIEGVLEGILRELKLSTIAQGVACLLSASSWQAGGAASLVFCGLAAQDLSPRASRASTLARVAAIGSLWPRGGRPASGWLGLKLTEHGWRGELAGRLAAAAALSVGIQAWRVRGTVEPARIHENVTFPQLCAVLGLAVRRAHAKLAEIDRRQLSLRQRAEYIEALAPAIEAFHDYVSPLKRGGHWWSRLEQADREELERLRRGLEGPAAALRGLIPTTDPLAEIQMHLAVRLKEVEIAVSGRQPVLDETRDADRLLARARRVSELIGRADEIVDDLLDDHPRSLLGAWPVQRVQLHLEPHEGDEWALSVHPGTTRPEAGISRRHLLHTDAVARATER